MVATYSFTIATHFPVSAEEVWNHASTFAGVNRELWPLVCMTYPAKFASITAEAMTFGRAAFRSWILLFGVVPIEYDDFTLVELEPGRRFLEVSRLFSMREWRHQRTVMPSENGCTITDEITMVPRWRGTGWFLSRLYRAVFVWRHRRLRRIFPTTTPALSTAL